MTQTANPHAVQTGWLRDATHAEISVLLTNGKQVTGELLEYDQFSLLVFPQDAPAPVLIYKHAVAALSRKEAS